MSRAPAAREPVGRVRVVHLTSVHDALDVRVFHKECRSLAAAGYDVVLVAPHSGDETCDAVRIRAVEKPLSRLQRMTLTSWRVFRAGVDARGQVYHLHDLELLPFGLLLKALGKRVLYDAHENAPKDILSKHYLPRWVRAALSGAVDAFERAVCACLDGVITVTPEIARRFPPGKTVVVRNYPRLEEFASPGSSPYPSRDPVAVYVGGLSEIRGVREMIRAVGQLEPRLNARLWLAGRFDPPDLEAELAREPGWARTERLGWRSRPQIVAALDAARVGVLVLHPAPNHLDSLPIKLFEYMAAGLPVVASRFPAWQEVLGDAGMLVDPLDVQAIAAALQWLIEHPEEAERMGRLGREAVAREFNWEREVGTLLALYRKVARQ